MIDAVMFSGSKILFIVQDRKPSLTRPLAQHNTPQMSYQPRIVLQVPVRLSASLKSFVEACLSDGVELIAVIGAGCEDVHDLIDDIIVGGGSDDSRFIATTWHPGESLDQVVEFAGAYRSEDPSGVEVISL